MTLFLEDTIACRFFFMDVEKDISVLNREAFLQLKDYFELAFCLQAKHEIIRHHCYYPQYSTFFLIKKSGGIREIEAPVKSLKRIQRNLNSYLNLVYNTVIPDSAHGFISKKGMAESRSIVSNAKKHTYKKVILSMDIKDFFHSISDLDVLNLFQSAPFQFNYEVAFALTKLTTYKGRLPMGAPTSPVLSNLYCLALDRELEELCKKEDLTYSRYADDLSFSGQEKIRQEFIDRVKEVLLKYGFRLNNDKFRFQPDYFRQEVTGIKVNRKANVDRKYVRRLRAILHNMDSKGPLQVIMDFYHVSEKPSITLGRKFFYSIDGQINHVGYVRGFDDPVYLKLRKKFNYYKEKAGLLNPKD